MKQILEFLFMGILTPIFYVLYSIFTILITFLIGFPIAVGIYLIQMAIKWMITGGIYHANL